MKLIELSRPLRENGTRYRKGLMTELELWRQFWNADSRFDKLNLDIINTPYICSHLNFFCIIVLPSQD